MLINQLLQETVFIAQLTLLENKMAIRSSKHWPFNIPVFKYQRLHHIYKSYGQLREIWIYLLVFQNRLYPINTNNQFASLGNL